MTISRLRTRWRSVVNATNAKVLSRLNRSIVVSGYPKTGTTYLSHLAERATGMTYIEGSMRLALISSIVHTHFRAVPPGSVFSYRPIATVMASFVLHRLLETEPGFATRIASDELSDADRARIIDTARRLLAGTRRMPAPSVYYADVARRGGVIVDVTELKDPDSAASARLGRAWNVPAGRLAEAIAAASALSEARRAEGHEFYNRRSGLVQAIIGDDSALCAEIGTDAERTRAIVERYGDA